MSRVLSLIALLVAALCMLSGCVKAQQVTCAKAPVMQNVNITKLVGTWFEVKRSPNIENMGCIEVDLAYFSENKTLDIDVTYVDPQKKPWVNTTAEGSVVISTADTNADGVSVTLSVGTVKQGAKIYKLLDTDYTNYAIVCGYTDVANDSTSFGVILTRLRIPKVEIITGYEEKANKSFTNFANMSSINQNQCYKSSAATPLPLMATIFALVWAIIKYTN